ncbi:MAG: ABC transporter substrate-binding protein [Gemmatimonadaceae bacterium]|nr:ABC transporter substrate-binding protein [Acetobacteraceae bacterium]
MRHLILAAACVTLLTGAASAQTLRIALREDPDIMDPTLARTYVGRIVFAGLCDKLLDINEKLEIVPQLALSHEWTDPTTLVLKLRPGVVFHDGEAMDAAAVKYSLERHLTMAGSFRRSEINVMDRVEVVDPLTVRIVLKTASSPFVSQLTDRAGMIVSPKAAEAAGKDFGLKPVCTGPFRFVERVPQDRIVLERFPGYWNKDAIKLDRVVYQPIPDSSIRLANLQAGSIEMSEQILPTDADAVRSNPRLRLVVSDPLGYWGISMNLANGPRSKTPLGSDARVRQAFELSLDKATIIQVVYNGLYAPIAQALPPASPFYAAGVQPLTRDVARAKALLKEAGVTLPVPIALTVPNNPDQRQVGEIVQAMAAEAGFDVRITASEYASALAAATRGEFEAFSTGWSGRVDPDGNLFSFMHSTGALNDTKYSNPKVDALLEQARTVQDLAGRRAIYEQVVRQTSQDLPILYLWNAKNVVGMSARVTGFRPVPDGMIRLQGVGLAR